MTFQTRCKLNTENFKFVLLLSSVKVYILLQLRKKILISFFIIKFLMKDDNITVIIFPTV